MMLSRPLLVRWASEKAPLATGHTYRSGACSGSSYSLSMRATSEIAAWYRGKSVFITGATGFMGKVLVEKLLRSCPDVGPIYVLARPKNDILPQDRVNDITKSLLFDRHRTAGVNLQERLIPIPGDITHPNLGISNKDRSLLQNEVSVVFHLAATVKFDEPLRVAMAVNFEGTRSVMQLCREMTGLDAVVHVSTAYSNCILSLVKECVHAPPMEPEKVVQCVAGMDDDLLESVTPRLLGEYPNTYTFTKALAEQVVDEYSKELPIVLVRPSIVTAIWREPISGWIDNNYGPTAFILGGGTGLMRALYGKGEVPADVIPVDVCTNLFIAAAWEIGNRDGTKLMPEVRVYNCVSGPFKSLSWDDFFGVMDSCMKKYPFSRFLTTPGVKMNSSRALTALDNIPEPAMFAILADTWIRFSGGKPRLQRSRHKMDRAAAGVEYFVTREFKFIADNVKQLECRLTPGDRAIFNFDMTTMNWEEYLTSYFLGVRKYVMYEEDETIPDCRQRVVRRRVIRKAIQVMAAVVVSVGSYQLYSV